VRLSDRTGGIQAVTFHGQRGNRVSQQCGFRFERELSLPSDSPETTRKTHWAIPRLLHSQILETGPVFAAVETITEFLSPADNSPIGRTRQITRVDRLQPAIDIEIELTDAAVPVRGNPWLTGWCCRFAWDNEAASITRSVLGQLAGFRLERIESPDFVEIADGPQRLTILSDGRPWHRRSGNRMLDSLMQVEGEHQTRFHFRIEFDQPSPLRSAENLLSRVISLEVPQKRPKSTSAWILGLSARNVQLVQARWLHSAPQAPDELSLILSETEGLPANCHIRTARPPAAAWLVNHDRSHKVLLEIDRDAGTLVPLRPFQVREVLLTF
jgi:alpha-mannosidase